MSAATQIYYDISTQSFSKLAPALRARVEAEIDRTGLRLIVSSPPIERVDSVSCASEIIGSSTRSMRSKTPSICSLSVTGEKSIGRRSRGCILTSHAAAVRHTRTNTASWEAAG